MKKILLLLLGITSLSVNANTYIVSNTDDAGPGSLRQAIINSNNNLGLDDIEFTVSGQINLNSDLPNIQDIVTIDASTSPTYVDGNPSVIIRGSGGDVFHLVNTASQSIIKGLSFLGGADAIELEGCSGVQVLGCWFGLNAAGTSTGNPTSQVGVKINGGDNNVIGAAGITNRNVFMSVNNEAIRIENNSNSNSIKGNYIGLAKDGITSGGNVWGIFINNSSDNIIGGSVSGEGNIVCSSSVDGIRVEENSKRTVVKGNYIGIAVDGTTGHGNGEHGVLFINNADDAVVGGVTLEERNYAGDNGQNGFSVNNSKGLTVVNNYSGLNVFGTGAIKNGWSGLSFSGGSGFTITDNVFSGNNNEGVYVREVTSANFSGNYIGVTSNGVSVLRNRLQGISVNNSSNVIIEGGNVISGNGDQGIQLNEAKNSIIKGNIIGLNATGTAAIPNEQQGIEIKSNSTNTTIGGILTDEQNIISGNAKNGVWINSNTTTLINNIIGSGVNGTENLGNGEDGVAISGSSNHTISGNIISFNTENGIDISNSSSNNEISENSLSGNTNGVFIVDANSNGNEITKNSFSCNSVKAIHLNGTLLVGVGNNNKKTPVLNQSSTVSNLNGTADPFDIIEIYLRDDCSASNTCNGAIQVQGKTYVSSVTADASGNWTFNSTLSVNEYAVTATTASTNNTSEFSVINLSQPIINADGNTFCEGDSIMITTDTISGFIYTWFKGVDPIESGNELTVLNVTEAGDYKIKIAHPEDDGLGKCSVVSASVSISMDSTPTTAEAGEDQIICSEFDNGVLDAITPLVGIGLWTSTTGSIDDVNNANSPVSDLQSGKTVFVWTVSNGVCESSVDSVVIEFAPKGSPADAGEDQLAVCADDTVFLSGSVPLNGEEVLWTSSGVVIEDEASFNASIVNLTKGDYVIKYTVSSELCGTSDDSLLVSVGGKPVLTAFTGDDTVCFNVGSIGTAEVFGADINTVEWILPANVAINSTNNNAVSLEFLDTQEALVKVTAASGSCLSDDTLSLLMMRQNVDTPDFDKGNASCAGVLNTLKVINPVIGVNYVWSLPAGTAVLSTEGDSLTLETPNTENFTVSLVAEDNGCLSDTIDKELDVFTVIESLNLDGLIQDSFINENGKCDSNDERFDSTTILRALVSPSGLEDLTFTWEKIYGDVTTQLASDLDTHFVSYGLEHGWNAYRVTVSNNKCAGNTLQAIDSINVLESIEANFEVTFENVVCEDDVLDVMIRNILFPTEHDENVRYTWYHNNYAIETNLDNYVAFDTLTVVQVDTSFNSNTIVLTENMLFESFDEFESLIGGNSISYDNYKVKGVLGDQITVKAEPEYCLIYDRLADADKLNLTVDAPVISRPGANATAIGLGATAVDFSVSEEELLIGGYVLESDELLLGESNERFALYDNTVRDGFTFTTGTSADDLIRNWYQVVSDDSLSQENIKLPQSIISYPGDENNPATATYMLKVENEACADSDFVSVKYEFAPWIPNAFSPNGDSKFDTFEIFNVDKYEGTKVTIFNRWGTKIVEIENYHLEENWWDGTKGGEPLPTGAYFYLVDFNNDLEGITGVVSLVK